MLLRETQCVPLGAHECLFSPKPVQINLVTSRANPSWLRPGTGQKGTDSADRICPVRAFPPDDKAQRRKRGQPKHGQWLRDCGQGNHITNTVIHQAAVKTAAGRTTKNI